MLKSEGLPDKLHAHVRYHAFNFSLHPVLDLSMQAAQVLNVTVDSQLLVLYQSCPAHGRKRILVASNQSESQRAATTALQATD
jgi:hypothetical protein